MSALAILGLDGLHPALMWGILGFYALFAAWIVTSLLSYLWHRGGGTTDLDRKFAPRRKRPAFAKENVKDKQAAMKAADSYENPEDRRAREAAKGRPVGLIGAICKITGFLVVIVGVVFIALLVYALIARPEGGPASMFSAKAWDTLLATHWLVIVFTVVRTAAALLNLGPKTA